MTSMQRGFSAIFAGSRVSVSDARGDSVESGRARVILKLGAIAYVNSQIGIDANVDVSGVALDALCESAVQYWQTVTRKKYTGPIDRSEATKLRVAALAYVNARHGVDATVEMSRMGMGILAEAALAYVESLIPR